MLCPAWVVSYFFVGAWSYLEQNKNSTRAFFIYIQPLRGLMEND